MKLPTNKTPTGSHIDCDPRPIVDNNNDKNNGFMPTLKDARQLWARISSQKAADLIGVSPRTYRRWEQTRPPTWAVLLLHLIGGDLGKITSAWQGWRIVNGKLYDPSDTHYTPGYILSFVFRNQQLQAQRVKIRELEKEIKQLKATPTVAANDSFYYRNKE